MRSFVLLAIALTGCTSYEGTSLLGQLDVSTTMSPSSLDIAVVYASGESVSTTVAAPFPTMWHLDVPAPSDAAFENGNIAKGTIWVAAPATPATPAMNERIEKTGFELWFLSENPGAGNLDGLAHGWNLVARTPVYCEDRIALPDGAYTWPVKRKVVALDTFMEVRLGDPWWEPPTNCAD